METRCEIPIRGLWESQTEAMVYIILGDPYCNTHKKDPMEMLLDQWEK